MNLKLLKKGSLENTKQFSNLAIKQGSPGFTLIELLIAIVIIGILTALLTANFIGARQRARDAKRKSDLRQIQSALELYRADSGNYPAVANVECGGPMTSSDGQTTYMQSIPCDSLSGWPGYEYTLNVDETYSIFACLENESDRDADVTNQCSSGKSFTVLNP